MRKGIQSVLIAALTLFTVAGATGLAHADVNNSTGTNVQNGSNRQTTTQGGASKSGSAVGGQVTGVVSAGRTSVDATNKSTNSDVTSGDARGSNSASTFTGLNFSNATGIGVTTDITGARADNLQDGSNRSTLTQTVDATTGDGVAGEVIGAVTAAGGSASIVAANSSSNDSVTTGDARGTNSIAAFTGLDNTGELDVVAGDITGSCSSGDGCGNVQNGNNRTTAAQTAADKSGDGIAGQVIGAVSGGRTSIDARNSSDSVDVTTGDATTDNTGAFFTGQVFTNSTEVGATDITNSCNTSAGGCVNVQDGDNTTTQNQSASSTTGDGVGGQVIGAVTSAGGSASVVAANTSSNSDITTGDATSANDAASFVGLDATLGGLFVSDISNSCVSSGAGPNCGNVQNGSDRLTGSQTATSATGDGVGGQVLGVVSAGAASLDATNKTDDSSVSTGDSKATNDGGFFVGLAGTGEGVSVSDVSGAQAFNIQDGSNRRTFSQSASAGSGDGIAGQVSGVVTSAGGSASVVLANTSTGIDSTSGQSTFSNDDSGFVGLDFTSGPVSIGGGTLLSPIEG